MCSHHFGRRVFLNCVSLRAWTPGSYSLLSIFFSKAKGRWALFLSGPNIK